MTTLIKKIQANWIPPNDYELAKNEFRVSTSVYCQLRVFLDKIFEQPELQTCDDAQKIHELQQTTTPQDGIFAAGHAYHQYVQSILPDDYLVEKEKLVTAKYKTIRITGHLDLLLRENGELKVCDIKTCKPDSYYYKSYQAGKYECQQANLYAYLNKTPTYSILYINKVTFDMTEYTFPTNPKQAEDLLESLNAIYLTMLQTIDSFPSGGKLTGDEIKATNEDWECRYCPYNEVCPQ